ncbi:MAG: carotenoid biosynthesis protein [Bacteroidota bacterium]|jgi:putative membrane protein|nr:carotenoid biosynthesis protein [Bacteroidota bacterium]
MIVTAWAERIRHIPDRVVIGLIYLFFVAGALWNTLGVLQSVMTPMTPYVLIGSAMLAVGLTYRVDRSLMIAMMVIFIGTWAIEALGVATGFPFGTYEYTDALGWKVLGVSIVIPFAWLLVIAASDALTGHFFGRVSTLLAALFVTILDFFLEFAADALDLWHWNSRFPPISNYLSWFFVSFVSLLLLRDRAERRMELQVPAHLYIAMMIYFAVTFLGMKSGLLMIG